MYFVILFFMFALGGYLGYFGIRTLPVGHKGVSFGLIAAGSALMVFALTQALSALVFPDAYARWM